MSSQSTKAFLFDMDGVVVDSEPAWVEVEAEYLPNLFGKEVFEKMPNLIGAGLDKVLELASSLGAVYDRRHASEVYDEIARKVYERSAITPGVSELVDALVAKQFKTGLVTQSSHSWMSHVLPRLPFKEKLSVIISLHEHPDLRRKPAPDGYLEAFRELQADPKRSFILEDSQFGIDAGKASGAYTIAYRGNLVPGYEQHGADAYADTMADVITLVDSFDRA